MTWTRFDSLAALGALIVTSGLALWSWALALMWLGACLMFVGLKLDVVTK